MKNLYVIVTALLLLVSCKPSGKNQGLVLVNANGRMNHVLIVVDNEDWKGEIGDKVRDIIGEPIVGLPQPETQLSVSQVPLKSFGSMLKSSRSIFIIEKKPENNFIKKSNVYAAPQQLIRVQGESNEAIIAQLEQHKAELVSTFKEADIKTIQRNHRKNAYNTESLKTLNSLGVSMTIPKSFGREKIVDTGDFLWMTQRLTSGIARGDGTMNILVYSVPIASVDDEEGKSIIAVRDAIGEKYIPGSKEGMYMITEAAFAPFTKEVVLDGKKTFETRGKWEVKNDFMAGPFLNYSIVDKANNRIVVVEGFTYAPSVNKRDFMFELEAILRSVRIQ